MGAARAPDGSPWWTILLAVGLAVGLAVDRAGARRMVVAGLLL
jgi:hypothetical protein